MIISDELYGVSSAVQPMLILEDIISSGPCISQTFENGK